MIDALTKYLRQREANLEVRYKGNDGTQPPLDPDFRNLCRARYAGALDEVRALLETLEDFNKQNNEENE